MEVAAPSEMVENNFGLICVSLCFSDKVDSIVRRKEAETGNVNVGEW